MDNEFNKFLQSTKSQTVFFDRLGGNYGDSLITLGAEYVLQKYNIIQITEPDTADYILLNGGGGFNIFWGGGIGELRHYRELFPDKLIVMGPSTIELNDELYLEFCEICNISNTKIIIFCRELESLERLAALNIPDNVDLRLSDDFAFELIDSQLIKENKNYPKEHSLICMRMDHESSRASIRCIFRLIERMGLDHENIVMKGLRKIYRHYKNLLWSSFERKHSADFDLKPMSEKIHKDISSEAINFQDFVETIAKSNQIITERLHVGILAFMLDIPVLFVGNREYHKIQGVYEHSIAVAEKTNTKFINF